MPKISTGLSERLRLLPPRFQQAVIQRWCEKLYFMRQEVTAAKHTASWDQRQTHTLLHSYITLRWGDVQCVCVWREFCFGSEVGFFCWSLKELRLSVTSSRCPPQTDSGLGSLVDAAEALDVCCVGDKRPSSPDSTNTVRRTRAY